MKRTFFFFLFQPAGGLFVQLADKHSGILDAATGNPTVESGTQIEPFLNPAVTDN
jgi:hypothetical protein